MKTGDEIRAVSPRHEDFLSDESRIRGRADTVSFPGNEKEVQQIITSRVKKNIPITPQGSRTGISGGCVPRGGHILNLSFMNRIMGEPKKDGSGGAIRVQPGVTLSTLAQAAARYGMFWPPDPTETAASIGGIFANNAQGPAACFYGETHRYIRSTRVLDLNGESVRLKGGDIRSVTGSEGMLGPVVELELRLFPMLSEKWGVVFFFPSDDPALAFSGRMAGLARHQNQGQDVAAPEAGVISIEFLNRDALDGIKQYRRLSGGIEGLPAVAEQASAAVCLEIQGRAFRGVERLLEKASETAVRLGSDPDQTWGFSNDPEIRKFKRFRHAAMEAVTALMVGQIPAGSFSLAGSEKKAADLLKHFKAIAADRGIKPVVIGSPGREIWHFFLWGRKIDTNGALPDLLKETAAAVPGLKEHLILPYGIGKRRLMIPDAPLVKKEIERIGRLKAGTDPGGLWNPGNMAQPEMSGKDT